MTQHGNNSVSKTAKVIVNSSGAREVSPREILRSEAGREQIRKTHQAVSGRTLKDPSTK